jgi:hypothetical protein
VEKKSRNDAVANRRTTMWFIIMFLLCYWVVVVASRRVGVGLGSGSLFPFPTPPSHIVIVPFADPIPLSVCTGSNHRITIMLPFEASF